MWVTRYDGFWNEASVYHRHMCFGSISGRTCTQPWFGSIQACFLLLVVLSKVENEVMYIVMYVLGCWAYGPWKGIFERVESLASVTCYQSREYQNISLEFLPTLLVHLSS